MCIFIHIKIKKKKKEIIDQGSYGIKSSKHEKPV